MKIRIMIAALLTIFFSFTATSNAEANPGKRYRVAQKHCAPVRVYTPRTVVVVPAHRHGHFYGSRHRSNGRVYAYGAHNVHRTINRPNGYGANNGPRGGAHHHYR